jgi:hypothetical protein
MNSGYMGSGRPSVTSGPSGAEIEMSSTALELSASTDVIGPQPPSINEPLSPASTRATYTGPRTDFVVAGGFDKVSKTCRQRCADLFVSSISPGVKDVKARYALDDDPLRKPRRK